ncbi:hypothetical protein LB521_27625 [Mesorhizobium sp. BR-1-1-8]|uniref:hypothetical protein n=1 Tax=Mesorhizobium sp. BR-1-1-8 TaxID=2876659 RepID=UPI001CCC15E2|nr:hypothetical protein [Mesorhizobium sp. BR-1-1-8]MBZ9984907.1 hypothetical protein [Mesorhizobium sp. BR-1-1-8]
MPQALRLYEAASKEDGWIEWAGGRRPVGRYEPVDVRFRNGEVYFNDMGWSWGHVGGGFDIVAYRLAK